MKILSVNKQNSPFHLSNGGTIYSIYGSVLYQNMQYNDVLIRTFKQNMMLTPGMEYDDAKHNIKFENKQSRNGKQYQQFTIYAEKKEYNNYKKNVQSYTLEEFDDLWTHAKKMCTNKDEIDTYFRCATIVGVKVKHENLYQEQRETVNQNVTTVQSTVQSSNQNIEPDYVTNDDPPFEGPQ